MRAIVVVAALLALGATSAAAAPPQITLTSGHADWGIKESFRNYISSPIAHGDITTAGGATKNADGTFRFPLANGTYDLATHSVNAAFDGEVRFTGHDEGSGPLLDLTISDPRLTTSGDAGTLRADMRSKNRNSGELVDYPDVALATLDLSASAITPGTGTIAIAPIAATLTADGSAAFGGFYQAGEALDPLALAFMYSTEPAPGPEPDPSPTPSPQPNPEPKPGPAPSPEPTPGAAPQPNPGQQPSPGSRGEPGSRAQQGPKAGPSARIKRLGRAHAARRNRAIRIARVSCRVGPCKIDLRKRVTLRFAGKRRSARVIAPRRIADGRRATIRVKLGKRARSALRGHRARLKLRVKVRGDGRTVRRTLRVTLRGARAKHGRRGGHGHKRHGGHGRKRHGGHGHGGASRPRVALRRHLAQAG